MIKRITLFLAILFVALGSYINAQNVNNYFQQAGTGTENTLIIGGTQTVSGYLVVTGTQSVSGALDITCELNASSITVTNALKAKSLTPTGSYTGAELQALTPDWIQQMVINSDVNEIYVSTGTSAGQWVAIKDYTTAP